MGSNAPLNLFNRIQTKLHTYQSWLKSRLLKIYIRLIWTSILYLLVVISSFDCDLSIILSMGVSNVKRNLKSFFNNQDCENHRRLHHLSHFQRCYVAAQSMQIVLRGTLCALCDSALHLFMPFLFRLQYYIQSSLEYCPPRF